MAGHSRPKDGVFSHAYVPAIHVFRIHKVSKTWMPATSAGMTEERRSDAHFHSFPRKREPSPYEFPLSRE